MADRGAGRLVHRDSTSRMLVPGSLRQDDRYDVFVSHAKKLPESEDRAVWIADVVRRSLSGVP